MQALFLIPDWLFNIRIPYVKSMIILVMVNELMFVMLKNKTISVLKLVCEIYMNLAINDNPTGKNINIMCQNDIFPSYNYF